MLRCIVKVILIVLFAQAVGNAAHIVGGHLYYEYIGNDQYRITVKLYRDQNCTNCAPFDAGIVVGIFDGGAGHPLIQSVSMPRVSLVDSIPFNVGNPCLTLPEDIKYGEAIYAATVSLPGQSLWGYDIIYQRCCRTGNIVNLNNPGQYGITLKSSIPGIVNNAVDNSSPYFDKLPPVSMCIGDELNFDHSAIDIDGDSLSYEFYTPLTGGGLTQGNNCCTCPLPNPPCYNTISEVPWAAGYSEFYQIDGNPGLTIDPYTGFLYGSPTQMGRYIIGIKVKEFRNGFPIGEATQEFLVTVTACQTDTTTAIADQQAFCDGFTVVFVNNSQNSNPNTIWSWDFGDPNNPDDTSSASSPTYTYSDTGTYTITLIANAGFACADTTSTVYYIDRALAPAYAPPPAQCLEGNGFNFQAGGWFEGDGDFIWDFGSNANPSGSNDQDPSNISFLSDGYHTVTLTIDENNCARSYTDSVLVLTSPVSSFNLLGDTAGCMPFVMQFLNTSFPDTGISYLWNFGDGNTSPEMNPLHLYTQEGSYDVSLFTSLTNGCNSEISIADLITVYPDPIAGFAIDSFLVHFPDPEINVSDTSSGGISCLYELDGIVVSQSCDFSHLFENEGTYMITQTIENEFGCTDTTLKFVTVVDDRQEPEYNIFVPNAITPNNDNLNDNWHIVGIDWYPNNNVKIFDRWGTLVHERTPYSNTQAWDGSTKGEPLPTGTYLYLIDLGDGESTSLTGAIHLIR